MIDQKDLAIEIFNIKPHDGNRPALKINERTISYRELIDKAMLVASGLKDLGVDRETVGLVGQRKASSYIGLLGIIFSGCSFTPINPKYNPTRISDILVGSQIKFLVGDVSDLSQLEKSKLSQIDACIVPESNEKLKNQARVLDQHQLTKIPALSEPEEISSNDIAYINYTSGTTGVPKGVIINHGNFKAFLDNMNSVYKLAPGFRASQTFDLSFDPSISDIFFTWMKKGCLCVLPEQELLLPSDFIKREQITFWNSVPSIARFMLKTGNLKPNSFPSLTNSMFCGEGLPIQLADSWRLAAPNSTIENLYGPTETTIYITRFEYQKQDLYKDFHNNIVPIGKPFPNHTIELIDKNNERIEVSKRGEIVISGPQVSVGYLNNKEKTADAFVTFEWDKSHRIWYKTGDLGFINLDGQLECIGRIDSQIKIAGRRIEIEEIESVLSRFSHTRGAIVSPVRDEAKTVLRFVAFVTYKIDNIELKRIREKSGEFLDSIFFPMKFIEIKEIPLTQSGKIDRRKLEKLAKEFVN